MEQFQTGQQAIVFNCIEWSKTGDLPEGNSKYYQKAIITKIYKSRSNEPIADVIFENGLVSHGHFINNIHKL